MSKSNQLVTRVGIALSVVMIVVALAAFLYPHRARIADKLKGVDLYDAETAIFKRGNPDIREVALTIDDGPHPEYAPQILAALRHNHVHATFFVVGSKVAEHPELVKRMLADGNEVGNHSMTHPRLDTLSQAGVEKELSGCEAAVEKATGYRMKLMRPPGVRYTKEILMTAKTMKLTTVSENVGAKDFIVEGDYSWYRGHPGYTKHVSEIQTNVLKQLKNGSIIDLHDMPATADALDPLIKSIKASGYKIVTATQLLRDLPANVRPKVGS